MKELNETVSQAEQQYEAATNNAMRHYEKFIMGEIDRDTFGIAQAAMRDAQRSLSAAQTELEECLQNYRWLMRMQKVCCKDLPLVEIMDEINSITVETGKKVVVQ